MTEPDPRHPDPVHGGEADRWGGWDWDDPARGEHFRRCSYCGSMHPEDLVAEPSWRAEWSDRKYGWPHKFYVEVPNQDPDRLYVISSASHVGSDLTHFSDLTREEKRAVRRDGYLRSGVGWGGMNHYYGIGTRSHHFGKFYSVHLADPQIPVEVKETIYRISGVRITFTDGKVRWDAS